MLIFFILFIFAALAGSMLIGTTKAAELERKKHILESYTLSMQQLYQMIQERIDATRRYRHDLAKHIQTLELLLDNNEKSNDELEAFVDKMKNNYRALSAKEFSSEEIINAVLVLKKEQCREKGIPFHVHVQDDDYGMLEDVDVTGLLYNLLDNAVEENEKITNPEERGIWFAMEKQGDQIHIHEENKIVAGKKLTFLTEKENKAEHGIGMQVIKSIVEKYHGTRKTKVDEDKHMLATHIVLVGEKDA